MNSELNTNVSFEPLFRFHKMRINQVDDEDADTLTYDLKTLLYYRPDLSVPDAPNQTICTISALMGVMSI